MSQTTTPAPHRAWLRAKGEPTNAQRAMDLAVQVCQVTAERDWLLVSIEGSREALLEVLVPAVETLHARWSDDLDDLDNPRQARPAAASRREAFAALAAAAAHNALTCAKFSLAMVLAHRSSACEPGERALALAELTMSAAAMRCPWTPTTSPERAAVAAALTTSRSAAA